MKKAKIHRRCAATPLESVSVIAPLSYPVSDAVIYSCIDLEDMIVAEILPRLHVKALFKFKCVSTRYNSIISDPIFARNYLQQAYTSPESLASSGLLVSVLYPFAVLSPEQKLSKNVRDLADTLRDGRAPSLVSTVSLPYDDDTQIFSSDTGSWVDWEVSCPREVSFPRNTSELRHHPLVSDIDGSSFDYRGVLHWLHLRSRTVFTYDPFDRPDRIDYIRLPSGGCCCSSSLIYSGQEEMLKYCEMDVCHGSVSGVEILSVWRLVDSEKGEWSLEGRFGIDSVLYNCGMLMVAPIPWNRDVLCHPFLMGHELAVINLRATRRRKSMEVFCKGRGPFGFEFIDLSYRHPLVPVELCPWSSPFYVQAKSCQTAT